MLEFLAAAIIRRVVPLRWIDPPEEKKKNRNRNASRDGAEEEDVSRSEASVEFPAKNGERMAMPIRLTGGIASPMLGHWADGSGRNTFKLYAGNRSAAKIADDMLRMIRDMWKGQRDKVLQTPFDVCPMAGRFNFDARGAWTAIDAGYSPDQHKVRGTSTHASPVVEFMAAWGLEHARPQELREHEVRYAVWRDLLTPMLARLACAGELPFSWNRRFHFRLALSGKNKITCFAQEDA